MDTTRNIQRIRPGTAFIKRAAVCISLAVALTLGIKSSATIVVGQSPYYSSITAACEAATADHSLVLLVFSAEWCGPCKQLKANTLSSAEFAEKAGDLKIVDVDVDADNSTATKYKVEAVPTLYLLSADMKIIAHKSGYQDVAALIQWITEGRERLARGEWEGSAPGVKMTELSRKAESASLTADEVGLLIKALEDSNPTERATAARLILAQRERAMMPLIGALTNQYLGTRIAASEILHKLAPASPPIDPWQSPAEQAATAAQIAQWWDATKKLPLVSTVALDPSAKNTADTYLKHLLGNDPIDRTEAMSGLVNLGAPVLPSIREALKRAEKQGNHRAVLAMEEVRWTILVSDSVEREIGPIRHILAQGTSPDRQYAAQKLGKVNAITPLAELANDTDPLVVESALRALSQIGGDEAIPAMKALLTSPDSNLRMTAAQGLGHTKNTNANPPLITVINDPNEVVACAALAGINEINEVERYSTEEKQQPSDVVAAVKRALSDPRWRVRAAAVESAGKLRATDLAPDIKTLLNDPDGFVVKNTLTTLSQLGSEPESEELLGIAKRLPGLRGEIITLLVSHPNDETVTNITAQFDSGKPGEREAILQAVAKNSDSSGENGKDVWSALFIKAAMDPEVSVRRVAAQALSTRPRVFAGKPALGLLNDPDPEVRIAAAEAVLSVVSGDQSAARSSRGSSGLGSMIFGGQKAPKRLASAEKLAEWHAALAKGPTTNALVAVALAVTGDGTNDLPTLTAAFRQMDEKQVRHLAEADCLGSLLKKTGWPQAKNLIDSIAGCPLLYTVTAAGSGQLPKEMSDYILEPARFVSALDPLPASQQDEALETLLQNRNDEEKSRWSLSSDSKRAKEIIPLFLQSTNALWRTVAIHLMSGQKEAKKETSPFEKALDDPNPWVKIAALKALITDHETPVKLQERVIPLLSDTNTTLAAMASMMLLQPALREALGGSEAEVFQFEKINVYVSYSRSQSGTLTPVLFTNQPAWLPQIRALASRAEPNRRWVYVLLLAQYGDFDLLDQVIATGSQDKNRDRQSKSVIYAGISLSNNPKYIAYLRQSAKSSSDVRILNVIRSMNTPEARQLRREVNLMLRKQNQSRYNNFDSFIEE